MGPNPLNKTETQAFMLQSANSLMRANIGVVTEYLPTKYVLITEEERVVLQRRSWANTTLSNDYS